MKEVTCPDCKKVRLMKTKQYETRSTDFCKDCHRKNRIKKNENYRFITKQ